MVLSFGAHAEIIQETTNRPAVEVLPNGKSCTTTAPVCTQGGETRTVAGIQIYKSCWGYSVSTTCKENFQDNTACREVESSGTCTISAKTCTSQRTVMIDGVNTTQCTNYQVTYTCSTGTSTANMTPEQLAEFNKTNEQRRLMCKPVQTCVGENCYIGDSEKDKPDEDMPYVLALLEIGNQSAKYMDKDNLRLFSGVKTQCRSKRGFGLLKQCCKGGQAPVAVNSSGQQVTATNANAYDATFQSQTQKYSDPTATANQEYLNGGANPYTYDSLYAPNEARYMLQGTESLAETDAGKEALANGGGAKLTVMGYGYSASGTATGDQQSVSQYSSKPKSTTGDD